MDLAFYGEEHSGADQLPPKAMLFKLECVCTLPGVETRFLGLPVDVDILIQDAFITGTQVLLVLQGGARLQFKEESQGQESWTPRSEDCSAQKCTAQKSH